MMKVPPLNLVGMDRLAFPFPFNPDLFWRYNHLGSPAHTGPPPSPSSAAVAVVAAASRANAAAASNVSPSPFQSQLPFAYDIKQTIPLNLAADPRHWSRDDVNTFLQWCEREFDLPNFEFERFQMNGKALCLLTKADLESRAPCSGDVIHNALHLLMTNQCSPLTPQTPSSAKMLCKGWPSIESSSYGVQQQNGTTSVTLSPAPSLDGQAGSPQDHGASGNNSAPHLSSASSSASNGSGGNPSDDSEYDSIGESPERSPVNGSLSPSPSATNGSSHTNGNHQLNHIYNHQNHNSNNNSSNSSSILTSAMSSKPSSVNGSTKSNYSNTSVNGKSSTSATTSINPATEGGEYNNNGRLLWDFLQQLLNDPQQRYNKYIAWKNIDTGIFKIVDPPGLAKLWGIQKNHLSMNYDKMSRALRYYYRVNILRKVQGERHCYQFLRNPGELKSIKNISMLRHQNSSLSALGSKQTNQSSTAMATETVVNSHNGGTSSNGMLCTPLGYSLHSNNQTNGATKSSANTSGPTSGAVEYESPMWRLHSPSPSSSNMKMEGSSSSYNGDGDYSSNDQSAVPQPQESPMSLTTKSETCGTGDSSSTSSTLANGNHTSSSMDLHSSSNMSSSNVPSSPSFLSRNPMISNPFVIDHGGASVSSPYADSDDLPTDLSMDTSEKDRILSVKQEVD